MHTAVRTKKAFAFNWRRSASKIKRISELATNVYCGRGAHPSQSICSHTLQGCQDMLPAVDSPTAAWRSASAWLGSC